MPDTFITKAIKKVVFDLSAKVTRPLDEIKRLRYNLERAAKKGTLTKADLDSAKGQLSNIRRLNDAIDTSPVKKVLDTTKTTVTTVKTGKEAALLAQLGGPGGVVPLGPGQIAIGKAEKLIESSKTALELGDSSLDGLDQVTRETGTTIEKTVKDIGTYEKYLAENKDLKEKEFQEEWDRLVANTLAHTFYGAEGDEGKLKRDWVEKDPEKYKLVLEHAEIHGVPISSIHSLSHLFTDGAYYWGLNQRVDAEVALYDVTKKWIKDMIRWWELNKIVIDRTRTRDAAVFGTTRWNELNALNVTDLDEMDEMKGNITSYRSDYKAWEYILLSLLETHPHLGHPHYSGFGSKIRSGRITAEEYNTTINKKQKDLLDKSVDIVTDLYYRGNPGLEDFIELTPNFDTGEVPGYYGTAGREVHMNYMSEGKNLIMFMYRYGAKFENIK